MSARPYPDPPWHTHGRAFVQPFLVDAREVALPPGFEIVSVLGRAVGVLGLVEYTAPSPLAYAELVWLPCLVRAGGVRRYYVDKMYVDDAASLAGGRELWALPKQLARFEIGDGEALVETEDGATLELELSRRGPAPRVPFAGGTVQHGGDDLVLFKGSGSARVSSGGLRVRSARGVDSWNAFASAKRLPAMGAALADFRITMHPPRRVAT